VDDFPAACTDTDWLASSKAHLGTMLKIKHLGVLSRLMGMQITRDKSTRTISLDQSKCLKDILAKHGLTDCKSSSLAKDPGFMSRLMGSLDYAAVCTRPDVSTTLSNLSCAQAKPREVHLQALKKVVRYLKGKINSRTPLGGGAPACWLGG
jgi:hypothetical protein